MWQSLQMLPLIFQEVKLSDSGGLRLALDSRANAKTIVSVLGSNNLCVCVIIVSQA